MITRRRIKALFRLSASSWMRHSLKTKLLILVTGTSLLAAGPMLYIGSTSLIEIETNRHKASFENTCTLLRGTLTGRYINDLAGTAESILNLKETMALIGNMAAVEFPAEGEKFEKDPLEKVKAVEKVLVKQHIYLALYNNGKRVYGDSRQIHATLDQNPKDYKGRRLHSLFKRSSGQSNDRTFSVVHVQKYGSTYPVLIGILYLDDSRSLVLFKRLPNTEESRAIRQANILAGIDEWLDSLAFDDDGAIVIMDHDLKALAYRGGDFPQIEYPDNSADTLRQNAHFEGILPSDKGDLLVRAEHFAPMDWIILAVIPVESLYGPARKMVRNGLLLMALMLTISVTVGVFQTMRILRPLGELTKMARRLSSMTFTVESAAGFSHSFKEDLPITRGDEIGQLAGAFAHMIEAIKENIHLLLESMSERKRIDGELHAAREIQMGILPDPKQLPAKEGCETAAYLLPAREVGGDLYDVFIAPDGRTALIIGDVSDKGVSAALFMSMTVTLVRAAISAGLAPAEAMKNVNDGLAAYNPSCMFVTLFIGLFDPESGRLDFASGGHCPPVVIPTEGEPRYLRDLSGPLVGAMEEAEFTGCSAVISPGECCMLYTDGITEAMNAQMQLFDEERLTAAAAGLTGASPDAVIHGILDAVLTHRGEAAQSDDMTMLCFRNTYGKGAEI